MWKMQVKGVLGSKGLWGIVTGKETEPEPPGDDPSAVKGKDLEWAAHYEAVNAFEQRLCQAYTLIITTVSQDICLSLEFTQDPKAAWDILNERFQPDGIVSRYSIFLQWVYLSFDGKNLQKFCQDYENALKTCAQVDIILDQDLQIYPFIAQITPFFENYATALRLQIGQHQSKCGRGSMPFTLNEVIRTALQETRQKDGAAAFNATRNPKGNTNSDPKDKGKEKGKGKSTKCEHCDTVFHRTDRCYHTHPNLAPDGWEPKQSCSKKGCRFNKDKSNGEKDGSSGSNMGLIMTMAMDDQEETIHVPPRALHSGLSVQASERTHEWCVDTGASHHMCNDLSIMKDVTPLTRSITFGEGHGKVEGVGSVSLKVKAPNYKGFEILHIAKVYYMPNLVTNLLSPNQLEPKGYYFSTKVKGIFNDKDEVVASTEMRFGLPHLQLIDEEVNIALTSRELSSSKGNVDLWHKRLGHAPLDTLKSTNLTGLQLTNDILTPCHDCKEATAQRIVSRVESNTPGNFKACESWSIDTVTVTVNDVPQAKYFIVFTDATTSFRKIYFSPTKVGAHFVQQHVNHVERMTGRKVKRLHLDNGTEFVKAKGWAEQQGIQWITTTPHNSQSNGRAEAANKVITTMTRKLLGHSGIPKRLWVETADTAVYLLNKTPSRRLTGKSPQQLINEEFGWTPELPYVGNLKAYGCTAFVLDHDIPRSHKFEPRGLKGYLVGYEGENIYRIWFPNSDKVVRSTNVTFDETSFFKQAPPHDTDVVVQYDVPAFAQITIPPQRPTPGSAIAPADTPTRDRMMTLEEAAPTATGTQANATAASSRPVRKKTESREGRESREYREVTAPEQKRLPADTLDALIAAPLRRPGSDEPKSYNQAMKSSNAKKWHQAL